MKCGNNYCDRHIQQNERTLLQNGRPHHVQCASDRTRAEAGVTKFRPFYKIVRGKRY